MSYEIQTSIQIQATPEQVWAVLTDFAAYPEWNPLIQSIQGTVAMGSRFDAVIAKTKFRPKVMAFEPARKFEWLGHLWIPGVLFDGHHRFALEENPDGTTTLHHGESFRGLLVPVLKGMLKKDTLPGFEAMNQALKARVEKGAKVS